VHPCSTFSDTEVSEKEILWCRQLVTPQNAEVNKMVKFEGFWPPEGDRINRSRRNLSCQQKLSPPYCQILRLKYTQIQFRLGPCPRPAGGSYSAPPDPLAGFQGPTKKEVGTGVSNVKICSAQNCDFWPCTDSRHNEHNSNEIWRVSIHRVFIGLRTVSCFPWGAGFPSNTMLPGLRPAFVRSGILIHPTVWPQYTIVTDRQRFRSI